MKILIAPDSFKNALPALEVAEAIRTGLQASLPETEIRILPMSDGGEGTVESVIAATGGNKISVPVRDPLFRKGIHRVEKS